MKVLVDARVFSTEAGPRGMGRYVSHVVTSLLRGGFDADLLLFDGAKVPSSLSGLGRITVAHSAEAFDRLSVQPATLDIERASRSYDVYLDATPFVAPPRLDLGGVTTVAIAYDLIPLRYPKEYLSSADSLSMYRNGLQRLISADAVLAISNWTAQHLQSYLGMDGARIGVLYPSIGEGYHDLPLADPHERSGVFALVGGHRSKNPATALTLVTEISSMLAEPATVVVPTQAQEREVRRHLKPRTAVEIVVEIDEAAKIDHQRRSRVVGHFSVDEGFGIPLLEAAVLGTPVVALDVAINREILGMVPPAARQHGSLLLDPFGPQPRRAELEALRPTDDSLRLAFERHWEQAPAMLASFIASAAERAERARRRPQLALVANIPDGRCGVADYNASLTGALVDTHEVTVFTDSVLMDNSHFAPGTRVRPLDTFGRFRAADPAARALFHLAFSPTLDGGVVAASEQARTGDVVVVHDLRHLFGLASLISASTDVERSLMRFTATERADVGSEFARLLRRNAPPSDYESLEREWASAWIVERGPELIRHIAELDEAPSGHDLARSALYRTSRYVPMPTSRSLAPGLVRRAHQLRQRMGVGPSSVLIGCFGSITSNKFLVETAEALATLEVDEPPVLLLVGSAIDGGVFARVRSALQGSVRLVHVRPEAASDFDSLLVAADLVLSFRRQDRGQMSLAYVRSMAFGRPMVTNDTAGFPTYPGVRIVRESSFAADLQDILTAFIDAPPDARSAWARGVQRAFMEQHEASGCLVQMLARRD